MNSKKTVYPSALISLISETEKKLSHSSVNTIPGCIYTYLNPVSYLTALSNKELFCKMDGIFADGNLLVKAIKCLYGVTVTRRSFDMTSMAPELLTYAEVHGKSIYIVASKQEQVERAIEIFKERYPKLIIAGYRNGYFNSEDEIHSEAQHIVKVNPDFDCRDGDIGPRTFSAESKRRRFPRHRIYLRRLYSSDLQKRNRLLSRLDRQGKFAIRLSYV